MDVIVNSDSLTKLQRERDILIDALNEIARETVPDDDAQEDVPTNAAFIAQEAIAKAANL